MLYSMNNYETYFGIVNTLQSMDRNATYDQILEEEDGNLVSSIMVIKESLNQLIEDIGEEEAVDYLPVLERVEKFMEENEIEEEQQSSSYKKLKINSNYYLQITRFNV